MLNPLVLNGICLILGAIAGALAVLVIRPAGSKRESANSLERDEHGSAPPLDDLSGSVVIPISDWGGKRLPGAPAYTDESGAWIGMWVEGAELASRRVLYLPGATLEEAANYAETTLGAVYEGNQLPHCRWLRLNGTIEVQVKLVDQFVDPFKYPSHEPAAARV